MSMIPDNCRECEFSKTCTAAYYGSTTCKHEKAIVDKALAHPFYNLNGGDKHE